MRLGDLIEWGGRRWIVRRVERQTRTAIVHDGGQDVETIADDLDESKPEECRIIANPSETWPFVAIPQRTKLGNLLSVSRPLVNGAVIPLVRFQDWLIADPMQPGGAVFFNPALGLRLGDVLVATYQRGGGRIQIPRDFLSAAQVKERSEKADVPQLNVYDRLRYNPYEDDD